MFHGKRARGGHSEEYLCPVGSAMEQVLFVTGFN